MNTEDKPKVIISLEEYNSLLKFKEDFQSTTEGLATKALSIIAKNNFDPQSIRFELERNNIFISVSSTGEMHISKSKK